MKIKSLILSSVAALGFTSGAMAADLGTVLTSLDVCDALGISGLTISSDTNCLSITGGVEYNFEYGDYKGTGFTVPGVFSLPATDGGATPYDWDSEVDAWLQFVGTADSSFGPASATILIEATDDYNAHNEVGLATSTFAVTAAYVTVGDTTMLRAGLVEDSIAGGYDYDFTWWDNGGVFGYAAPTTGGHAIQLTSDLGNGVTVGGALENLNGTGTAVGTVAYAGNDVVAGADIMIGNILTSAANVWAVNAGITATVDMFAVGVAFAADSASAWDLEGSASVTYDMFTLAASGVAGSSAAAINYAGFSASASAEVTDGVTINAGFRWLDPDTATANDDGYQAAIELVAAVTETVTITGEVGIYGDNAVVPATEIYAGAELAWAPGGGFETSVGGTVYGAGAYSVTFAASKDFE